MKKFDNELAELQQRMSDMGDVANSMVRLIAEAIKDRCKDVHEEIATLESQVNRMQMDIDHEAIRMLTIYGPVATDLRQILVCTHVTSQFERMGDQCVNISQAMHLMRSEPVSHPMLPNLPKMADLVCEAVGNALDAYFSRNVEKATEVRRRDDLVDAMNDQIIADLLTDEVLREVLSGAKDIGDAVAQILVARYLERIADQAKNICKEVIYLVRGDDVRHKR